MNYGPEQVFSFVVGLCWSLVGLFVGWFGFDRHSGPQFVSAHCPDCAPILHCHPSPPIIASCSVALCSWPGFYAGLGVFACAYLLGAWPKLTGWASSQHRAAGGASLSIGERPAVSIPRERAADASVLTLPAPAETVVWQSRRRSPTADGS